MWDDNLFRIKIKFITEDYFQDTLNITIINMLHKQKYFAKGIKYTKLWRLGSGVKEGVFEWNIEV